MPYQPKPEIKNQSKELLALKNSMKIVSVGSSKSAFAAHYLCKHLVWIIAKN